MTIYATLEDTTDRLLRPMEYRYQPALLRGDLPVLLAHGAVGLIRMSPPKLVLDGSDYSDQNGTIQLSGDVSYNLEQRFKGRRFELSSSDGMYYRNPYPNSAQYSFMLLDLKKAEHS